MDADASMLPSAYSAVEGGAGMRTLVWGFLLLAWGCSLSVPGGTFRTALWMSEETIPATFGMEPFVVVGRDDCTYFIGGDACVDASTWWANWLGPYVPGLDPYGRIVRNPWMMEHASPRTAPSPTPVISEFQQFDLDRNGLLSQTEYVEGKWSLIRFFKAPTAAEVRRMKRQLANDFHKADLTRDGWLNAYEYRFAHETKAERQTAASRAIRQLTLR